MPGKALLAGVVGALALFAIVVGAYALTSSPESAEACRYRTGCDERERGGDDCVMRPVSLSSRDDCRPEPPICETSFGGCCEIRTEGLFDDCCETSANFLNDPCEPPPVCDLALEGCCEVGTDSLYDECCQVDVTSLYDPCEPPPVCERSLENDCCLGIQGIGEYNPCCDVQFSTAQSDGCGCGFPTGVNLSSFGCEPREDDRCERRSVRRIGRWPAEECRIIS